MNLPPLSLHHLHCLTDATSIIQRARRSIRDRHSGHTGDDNKRALVLTVHLQALRPCARADQLLRAYLAFLRSVQRPDGWFMNLAGDDPGQPRRSLRGLLRPVRGGSAEVVQCETAPPAIRDTVRAMLQAALPACLEASDRPRVRQDAAGSGTPADACDVTAYLADRLVAAYWRSADREWRFS